MIEPLEARMLLSASLVKDVVPGTGSSFPSDSVSVGDRLFFTSGGLWVSDGTGAGTERLKKETDAFDYLANLTRVRGTVYFTASTRSSLYDLGYPTLWKSNGTAAGTVPVKKISPNIWESGSRAMAAVGSRLFFAGSDSNGQELWVSDGTATGTHIVKDINPGSAWSMPDNMVDVGGTLYFVANDGSHDRELWKSDGTAQGTVLVRELTPGGARGGYDGPTNLTNVGGKLFFVAASDGWINKELYVSDGTYWGTHLVKEITPSIIGSGPHDLTNLNGTLIFGASDGSDGLWRSDGTAGGTVQIGSVFPASIVQMGSAVYFSYYGNLWISHGLADDTQLVKMFPGVINPSQLTVTGNTLFFVTDDEEHGVELWQSDGTTDGTVLVADINPGASNSNPASITPGSQLVYFTANDGYRGVEVWKTANPSAPPLPDHASPTAALAAPVAGQSIARWVLNNRQYLDVTFADRGRGIDPLSIMDTGAEFVLSGRGASGVQVNGAPTLVSGTTYRYQFSGRFKLGEVTTTFRANGFQDMAGNGNVSAAENFRTILRRSETGTVYIGSESRQVTIQLLAGSGTAIDPTRTTWLVTHGWDSSPDDDGIQRLAKAIHGYKPADQVLLLDWRQAADTSVGQWNPSDPFYLTHLAEAQVWIDVVADFVRKALMDWRVASSQVNLIGHSLGAYVSAAIAKQIATRTQAKVNSIVALDPAQETPGYDSSSVSFRANAAHSWAFWSGGFCGSSTRAKTAAASFEVSFRSLSPVVPVVSDISWHSGVVDLFASMVAGGSRKVSAIFSLDRISTSGGQLWATNPQYPPMSGMLLAPTGYEGILVAKPAASGFWSPTALVYRDSAGANQTLRN